MTEFELDIKAKRHNDTDIYFHNKVQKIKKIDLFVIFFKKKCCIYQ